MSSQPQLSQRQTRKTSKAASASNIASNAKAKKQTSNSRKRPLEEAATSDSESARQSHKENPAVSSSVLPDETPMAITSTLSSTTTDPATNADQAITNMPDLAGMPHETSTNVNHPMSDIPISRLIADAQKKTADIGMAEKDTIAACSEFIQPAAEDSAMVVDAPVLETTSTAENLRDSNTAALAPTSIISVVTTTELAATSLRTSATGEAMPSSPNYDTEFPAFP
jgi:hypothetical protein